jgi:hypothetical protein
VPPRFRSLDEEVKHWLDTKWPTKATQLWLSKPPVPWIRAQPIYAHEKNKNITAPRLIAPGSKSFHIQPDGLWFTLGIPSDELHVKARYADCVVIEACKSRSNFLQKRGMYAARTASLELDLRKSWLDRGVPNKIGCRRSLLGGELPEDGCRLPIRHLRVLYVLPNGSDNPLYATVSRGVVLDAHEFVCRVERVKGYHGPQMQTFLKSMAPSRHFLDLVPYGAPA